jgi:hypothetical protein
MASTRDDDNSGATTDAQLDNNTSGERTRPEPEPKGREVLSNLFRELFQTEQSAVSHPKVEAERLGDVPPARAMLAVSAHAEAALTEIRSLAKERGMVAVEGGKAVGSAFSVLRDSVGDLLLSHEKSYRGTILGMRHGIDLMELIQYLAAEQGDPALAAWCGLWLEQRRALVEATARELSWFAMNLDRAVEPVKNSPLAHGIQAIVHGVEQIAEKLRQ